LKLAGLHAGRVTASRQLAPQGETGRYAPLIKWE